jgi:hypothetical protein
MTGSIVWCSAQKDRRYNVREKWIDDDGIESFVDYYSDEVVESPAREPDVSVDLQNKINAIQTELDFLNDPDAIQARIDELTTNQTAMSTKIGEIRLKG